MADFEWPTLIFGNLIEFDTDKLGPADRSVFDLDFWIMAREREAEEKAMIARMEEMDHEKA